MAKSFGKVEKIYQLKTLGFDDITKQLDVVNKKFELIKKTKHAAEGKLIASKDIADIQKYSDEVAQLVVEEQRLRVEQQKLQNEAKALNIQRAEQIRQAKDAKKNIDAEAGSIIDLRNRIRELNAEVIKRNQKGGSKFGLINFEGQNLSVDQAIAKLKELTAQEQEFRRQFAKDSTLVGEYTTGIVQAFKRMGLDDLIGGQITRAKERLNSLNTDFDRLQKELAETRAAGASTDTIEKQMIENRNEVIKLDTELARLKKDLRGTGDVGNQITTSIANGFKSLKGQVAAFALSYIGFSALFNKITSEISAGIESARKIEGVKAAFDSLNQPGLLDNLRAATRGTVSDLELMQRAVQARNFQIPLENLAGLLDFARRRAKDTGEEVNFLVESIILGIGRKSPLILDNLGISAVRLRAKLKGVSEETVDIGSVAKAVNEIIAEENAKLGKEVDTVTERLAKNKAEWQNLRTEFTKNLLPALATLGSVFLFLITNLPTIITLVSVLAIGWAVSHAQLVLTNAQLIIYNLLLIRNYIALGILSTVQLVYNASLLVFNGVLKVVTAGLRLFGITATAASGPLGIILTIVALLGTAVLGLSKAMGTATAAIDKNTLKLRLMGELQREAAKATLEQRLKAEQLVKVVNDLTLSEQTRNKALNELIALDPIFQKALVDGKINYEKLNTALKDYNKSLLESATLQAAQTKAQAENQELERLINLRTTFEERKSGLRAKDFSDLSEEEIEFLPNTVGSTRSIRGTASLFGIDISTKEINKAISNINAAIVSQKKLAEVSKETATTLLANSLKPPPDGVQVSVFERFQNLVKLGGTEADFKKLSEDIDTQKKSLSIFSKQFKDLKALQEQIENFLNPKEKTKDNRGSKLTGEQKDLFKDIDALRDQELADLKIKFQKQQVTEESFLLTSLRINRDAINAKLKLLKGANAEERKQIAELNLDKITQEQETNNKIFDLRAKALKEQLEQQVADIRLRSAAVELDPQKTETEKSQAKLDADNAILALQEQFNKDIDKLEKDLAQNSLNNAKESADDIRKTKEQILADEKELAQSQLTDIKNAGDKQRAEFSANYSKLRQAILNNDKLTARQRKSALKKLAKQETFTILSSELAQLIIEFKKIEELYKKGLASEKDFLEKKAELENKRTQQQSAKKDLSQSNINLPSEQTSQDLLRERLSKSFGFEEDSAEDQLLGQVISESFSLAQDAMNAYFDAEENRIRQNLEVQLERLEMEQKQVEARAQSQEEIAGIEKEFAAKKRKAEQEAGEQLKKSKRAEAKIALATELANIAASAAANPANSFTFGAAGVVMYAILAGLALGRYALRTSEINQQKFAFGGKPGEVPVRGGEFGGKPHSKGGTDFKFKGKNYNAEVEELAVIRTKDAPAGRRFKVEGTQMQIASAANRIGGGIDFKPGAKIRKFDSGGIPGGILQPPVFDAQSPTVIVNSGITKEDLDELKEAFIERTEATDRRIDRIQTFVSEKDISDAQKKQVKQSSIGTL
jgi:hypothetical protein